MVNEKAQEVIIVGAGPSGLTTARLLAASGIKTIVLERSADFRQRGFNSQIISEAPLERIFGKVDINFERSLSECRAYILQEDSFISVNSRNDNQKRFIVSREAINNWMINQVKKTGVEVCFGTVVRELINNEGKIIGVKTDDKELFCDVVVVAEGTTPILTKHSGLRKGDLTYDQVILFAEETIDLPSELIETRFNLLSGLNLGLAGKFFLDFNSLNQTQGIGYIFTNNNSISLGAGILLGDSISKEININQFLEKFKSHPAITPLIAGGITSNYASYMLPFTKGEFSALKLFADGCLVVGGAAMLVNPFSWDLPTLSVISGELAARTIIRAKEYNDFSSKTLFSYKKDLDETKEFSDLKNQEYLNGLSQQSNRNYSTSDFRILNDLASYGLGKNK